MFGTIRLISLLASLLGLFASPACATTLSAVFAQSETIAIVKLVELPGEGVPRKPRLNVLRVLKGHLGTGEQEVSFAEYEYPDGPTGEFVAFLDKERKWRFTAAPLWNKSVESDLLIVWGFAHRNVDRVSPAYLTLAQLTSYLKTGKLLYSFRGPIWFPQHGKIPWAQSDLRIEGTYDAFRDRAQVAGLGPLAGFSAEPSVNFTAPLELIPILRLTYSGGANRPLEIGGMVEGLDQKTGALIARFAVTAPDVLNEATLKKYLADTRLGRSCHKFRLRCAGTKDFAKRDLLLTLLDGDPPMHLEGWGRDPLEIESAGGESPRDYRIVTEPREGRKVVLDFELGDPTKDSAPWWAWVGDRGMQGSLLYRFDRAAVHGKFWLDDGKSTHAITTFSVDVDPVTFGRVDGK